MDTIYPIFVAICFVLALLLIAISEIARLAAGLIELVAGVLFENDWIDPRFQEDVIDLIDFLYFLSVIDDHY